MTIKLTREEAIQDLEAIKSFERYARGRLAIDMAIEALSEETSTIQEKHQLSEEIPTDASTKSTNIPTDASTEALKSEPSEDLIKRSDAIEAIEIVDWYHQNSNKDMVHGANDDEHQAWYKADDVYKALEAVPSADRPIDGDLISRQAAIDALYDKGSSMTAWGELLAMKWSDIQKCIEQLPSADRPKGKWIDEDGTHYANCSKCGYQMDTHQERGYFRYCPNCGSDMRGDME